MGAIKRPLADIVAYLPTEGVLHTLNIEVLKTVNHYDIPLSLVLGIAFQFIIDTHDVPHHEFLTELRHYDYVSTYATHIKNIVNTLPLNLDRTYIYDELLRSLQNLIEYYRYVFLTLLQDNGYGPSEITSIFNVKCRLSTHIDPYESMQLDDCLLISFTFDYLPF